jgi:hypothetical protein
MFDVCSFYAIFLHINNSGSVLGFEQLQGPSRCRQECSMEMGRCCGAGSSCKHRQEVVCCYLMCFDFGNLWNKISAGQ